MGSVGNTQNTSTRTASGENAEKYFSFGGYAKSYTPEKFAEDSRIVDTYRGIDFDRSGSYYEQFRQPYEQARKRWQKQIAFWKRGGNK